MGGLPCSPDKTKMDGWSSYSTTRFEEPRVAVLASTEQTRCCSRRGMGRFPWPTRRNEPSVGHAPCMLTFVKEVTVLMDGNAAWRTSRVVLCRDCRVSCLVPVGNSRCQIHNKRLGVASRSIQGHQACTSQKSQDTKSHDINKITIISSRKNLYTDLGAIQTTSARPVFLSINNPTRKNDQEPFRPPACNIPAMQNRRLSQFTTQQQKRHQFPSGIPAAHAAG